MEYIEVRGLELTNDRQEGDDDGKAYNDFNVMDRTGVAGVAQNKGTINHIVLDDLYVHWSREETFTTNIWQMVVSTLS